MKTHPYFPLPNKHRKIEKIDYSDILYLEGNINYTLIHLQNGKVKVSPRTLSYHITNSLNDSFIRIHRAYCINRNYIQDFDSKYDENSLLLTGGIKLAISRRKKKNLLANI